MSIESAPQPPADVGDFAEWRVEQMSKATLATDPAISVEAAAHMRQQTIEQEIQINEGAN